MQSCLKIRVFLFYYCLKRTHILAHQVQISNLYYLDSHIHGFPFEYDPMEKHILHIAKVLSCTFCTHFLFQRKVGVLYFSCISMCRINYFCHFLVTPRAAHNCQFLYFFSPGNFLWFVVYKLFLLHLWTLENRPEVSSL